MSYNIDLMPIEVVIYEHDENGNPVNVRPYLFQEGGTIDTGDPAPFDKIEVSLRKEGESLKIIYPKKPQHPTPVITVVEDSKFDPFPYGLIKHSIFARRT